MIRFKDSLNIIQEAAIESNTGWVRSRLKKAKNAIASIVKKMGAPTAKEVDVGNNKITNVLQKVFMNDGVFIAYNPDNKSKNEMENDVGLNGGYTAMGDVAPIMFVYLNKNVFQSVLGTNWNYFVERFANIIGHEQVHRAQYARAKSAGKVKEIIKQFERPTRGKTKQEVTISYLSNKYEISAWATTAFNELIGKGYTNEEILRIIRTHDMAGIEAFDSIMQYLDYFDIKDPTIKRFFKLIFQLSKGEGAP